MLFLLLNQHHQSTEGKVLIYEFNSQHMDNAELNGKIPRQLPAASTCWYVEVGSACLSKITTSRLDQDIVFSITSARIPALKPFITQKQLELTMLISI